MKHFQIRIISLVTILLLCNRIYAQSEGNLLENYSFEKIFFMQPNIFPGWLHHNNDNVVRSKDFAYDQTYSAKMSALEKGKTAIVNQVVDVTPNSKIRIRHHYYITQWKDKGARMYCYFRERHAESSTLSNEYLNSFYDTNTLRIIRGGGYGLTYFPHELNTWLTFDEVITVPPDAHNFVFEIHSFYGTTMYVDYCYVGEEEETGIGTSYGNTKHVEYYSVDGRKISELTQPGVYIVKTIDENNNISVKKVYINL